jgi:hypothetical protein
MLGLLAVAAVLHDRHSELYGASVQEDRWLEWGSFWAFAAAAAVHLRVAWQRRARGTTPVPWYLAGVGLFCAFVALEEISWGQRLFAARPPAWFLEQNAQQEINLHNLVDTSLRMWALQGALLGYGVLLPVLAQLERLRRLALRFGVEAPPLGLAPGFAAASALYASYPWSHTGEWVEGAMGLGFLFGALSHRELGLRVRGVATSSALVLTAAVSTTFATQLGLPGDAERIRAAQRETQALMQDLGGGRAPLRCNLHKRVYTYVRDYRASALERGAFQSLTASGLPAERAAFFLDPWNSPYWVRYVCDGETRVLMVYSFGPDRRRNSSRTQLRGDDIGDVVDPTRRRRER